MLLHNCVCLGLSVHSQCKINTEDFTVYSDCLLSIYTHSLGIEAYVSGHVVVLAITGTFVCVCSVFSSV